MCRWVVVLVLACVVVPSAYAKTSPETTAISAVIEDQFTGFRDTKRPSTSYTKDAMIAMTGGTATPQVNKLDAKDGKWTIFGPAAVGKHKIRDLRVVVARDGATAWASFIAKVAVDGLSKSGSVDFRVTQLFVKHATGWQVRAAAWSIGVPTATIAKAAKADKLPRLDGVFDQNLGERAVLDAVKSLAASGLDASATARDDVVGIGLTPGELTVGGKKLAAKLKKEWVDKLSLDGSIWALTAGSTATATVNVKLERGAATIPARLFAIFEKDASGAWSPVLVHLAVAPPP